LWGFNGGITMELSIFEDMVEPPLKQGDRIELISMPNDPCPIPVGTKGTVEDCVSMKIGDSKWQVWVKWDNKRTLSLVVPPDKYKIIGGK
jgi:hypothetical protein